MTYAVVTTLGFFVLLELALAVLGVEPVLYQEDPYVGFASYSPLFVEQRADGGPTYLATAKNKLPWFNAQQFWKEKPRNTYRIFCLGGSTTFGRPYDDATSFAGWLRAMLPAADESRSWEVINAGGISYASYRVAKLSEELAGYAPDLFIVYCGHNEFLEHRTYGPLLELPSGIRDAGALASRSRTYAAIRRLLGRAGTRAPRASQELLPGEVTTLLDQAVGPQAYRRDDTFRERALSHYHFNLRRIAERARAAGARTILVTPASNLRDCSPFKSELRADLTGPSLQRWQSLFDRATELHAAGRLDEALAALRRAASIDDRYADLHFLRGRILLTLGRDREAKDAFTRARDEDVCPLRALTPMCRIVAEVADEEDVPLIDFVAKTEESSEHGIPGADLFLDHVHPTVDAHRTLALQLIQAMIDMEIVRPRDSWGSATIEKVTERVKAGVDPKKQAMALRNLAKVLSWAGKGHEADRLALDALELDPEDAETQFQAGNAYFREGDLDQAVSCYRQTLRLDPNSAAAYYGLGLAAAAQGQLTAAAEHYQEAVLRDPGFTAAHYNLGMLLEDQNDLAGAAEHYRQAIRYDPRDRWAVNNLGVVLAKQGDLLAATAEFEKALRIDPTFADAHANLGRALAEQGDLTAAVRHFREAQRYQPSHPMATQWLQRMRE